MTKTLKTAALSALAGIAALVAVPSAAFAGSSAELDIWLKHGKHGPRGEIQIGGPDRDGPVRHEPRHHRNPQFGLWIDPFPRHLDPFPRHIVVKAKRCTVDRAVWKAKEHYGLRKVQVDYVTKHVIGLTGRKHGEWRDIVFSRSPGCPVIDY